MARPAAASTLLLLAVVSAAAAIGFAQSSRLVEKEIDLPVEPLLKDTPLIDPPKRIAGYFKLNRTHDARMFYFYFQSRNKPQTDPLVLWMTGGPGCSSEIAIFFENGPYSINNDTRTLSETKYGWDTLHNMIFVDQPIGTGFSYSNDRRDRVDNEQLVGQDMLDFLYAFYEAHPEMLANDFFVTGESYAGHYVPAVSSAIYRANELGQGPLTIPLKGLAIGNGLTNPAVQFPAYADYALENKIISKGLRDSIEFWMPLCTWGANFCDNHRWGLACVLALEVCQILGFQRILAAAPGINVYDITKTCDGPLCYDMSAADDFLNRKATREALGVGDRPWQECNMDVNGDFMADWLRSYHRLLPPMMEDGIRVMIYAGDLDLICNWVGNQRWVDQLEWEQSASWPGAAPAEWAVAGAAAGTVRQLGPLSFVRVYQAGHMVPMDQPRNALSMLFAFTRGHSLVGPQAAPIETAAANAVAATAAADAADSDLARTLAAAAAAEAAEAAAGAAKTPLRLGAAPRPASSPAPSSASDSLSLSAAAKVAVKIAQLKAMAAFAGKGEEPRNSKLLGGAAETETVVADKEEGEVVARKALPERQPQVTYRKDKPLPVAQVLTEAAAEGKAELERVVEERAAALGRHGLLKGAGAGEVATE